MGYNRDVPFPLDFQCVHGCGNKRNENTNGEMLDSGFKYR